MPTEKTLTNIHLSKDAWTRVFRTHGLGCLDIRLLEDPLNHFTTVSELYNTGLHRLHFLAPSEILERVLELRSFF